MNEEGRATGSMYMHGSGTKVSLHVFKARDEKLTPINRNRLAAMGTGSDGGTPDAEGVIVAGARLAKARANRKVLFVIGDGQGAGRSVMKRALATCHDNGIETVGIGICGCKMSEHFNSRISIDDPKQLATKTMQELERQMMKHTKAR